jgi:hypothetical protein
VLGVTGNATVLSTRSCEFKPRRPRSVRPTRGKVRMSRAEVFGWLTLGVVVGLFIGAVLWTLKRPGGGQR